MARLFGFSVEDKEKQSKSIVSPVPQTNEDGSDFYISSGFYGQYVDIEGVYKNEFDLIRRYREMALHPECDGAIEDVVNEAIVSDLYDSPVEIELTNLNASDKLKKIIREEFKTIKEILDFDRKAHEIFKNWYIDGKLAYLKVIDQKHPEEGIKDLRYIDSLKIRFIRQEKKKNRDQYINVASNRDNPASAINPELEEYYLYTPTPAYPSNAITGGGGAKGVKIAKDSITYCTSGLIDRNKGTVLSYLNKAIKALNQLRMIEDSLVIYRLSRAPERRIFYIDVGNLPKVKAEQYLKEVMYRYRNKLVYNASTGEVRDDRKFMSMMEDFWLPRREGGRGTEITTLPGGQNLGEMEDIEYFKKKLYRSLNVPISRLEPEAGFTLGRASEISRDELKFNKFIRRLRLKFSILFNKILEKQLVLKGIVTMDEWSVLNQYVKYDFVEDNHFAELKNSEMVRERLQILNDIESHTGTYYSKEWVRRNVLHQNEEEISDMKSEMQAEQGDESDYGPGGGGQPDAPWNQQPEEPEGGQPGGENV